MTISATRKAEVIGGHSRHDGDTGSPEVQIAILTERIIDPAGPLPSEQKRLLLPTGPSGDGQPPEPAPKVFGRNQSRGVPRHDQNTRPSKVGHGIHRGRRLWVAVGSVHFDQSGLLTALCFLVATTRFA